MTDSQPSRSPSSQFPGLDTEKLLDCIHCGICLSVCPTFDLLGTEADSPRGRIYLMRGLAEGRIDLNASVVHHLDTCLGCRACETACPSAVHYGELLTQVRDTIERTVPRDRRDKTARTALLNLLSRPALLAPMVFGARMAGALGVGALVKQVNRFLFGSNAPEMPLPRDGGVRVAPLPEFTPARTEKRARVALLAGCVMQVLFQRVNHATLRVLAENGCEVLVPPGLGCCGSLHFHNGELDEARRRARAAITACEQEQVDAILINSAGCGSAMKEYGELFQGDGRWEHRAHAVAAKVKDVSEFLQELGPLTPRGELRKRATYHDACHLAHGQQIRNPPRELLRSVRGLELVEFRDPDWCCGSAGIYNFLQPELAARLQQRKVDNVLAVEPELVVTGNPGCHAWIEAGLRARGSTCEVLHTIEVLDRAYQTS
jgi:glycolate oxidase iron-sulfur subunit